MCGRYGLSNPARAAQLAARITALEPAQAALIGGATPRYNITPASAVPAVVSDRDGVRTAMLQWGLIPGWSNDPSIGARLANARDDSARSKPAFRGAFAARRALVFADLFYEWQAIDGARRKQPWCVRFDNDAPFAFAALWERWSDRTTNATRDTFTLITTAPNAVVAPIHNRMPVIVAPSQHDRWLDLRTPLDDVETLLAPHEPATMRAFAVSTTVNSPRVDDASCIHPLQPARDLFWRQ